MNSLPTEVLPEARIMSDVALFVLKYARPAVSHRIGFACLVLLWGATCPAEQTTMPKPPGLERSLVTQGQGYFPVALRLADGRIAVVLRGGAGHLGLAGRLDVVYSSDEGKSWTKPQVVVDSPADDRNPAFGQAADGTLVVVFWRTETYDDQGHYRPKLDKPYGVWVTRSSDAGKTWSTAEPVELGSIGWASPYGRIETLEDHSMLLALYGGPPGGGPMAKNDQNHSYVFRSTDGGKSWQRLSEIGAGAGQLNETSLLNLGGGKLLAAARSRSGETWLATSSDGAKSWSRPRQITPRGVMPGDLCRLDDNRVLLAVGDRLEGYGARGMIGSTKGDFDWERRFVLVDDSIRTDCGYPSSVVLKDGRVLTVYYSTAVKEHPEWKVHCGALVYRPPVDRSAP